MPYGSVHFGKTKRSIIQAWRPFSANTTAYGMVMLVAYIAAAALCFVAARNCARHPHYRRGGTRIRIMRRERLLWEAMAAFLAIVAVYRQLDLTDLVTGLGRTIAVNGHWYDQRRPFQAFVLGMTVAAVGAGATVMIRAVAAANALTRVALAACMTLILLLGTNALSLHWTDAVLHSGYHRATVYNVVEAGSVATILAAVLLYRQEVLVVLRR